MPVAPYEPGMRAGKFTLLVRVKAGWLASCECGRVRMIQPITASQRDQCCNLCVAREKEKKRLCKWCRTTERNRFAVGSPKECSRCQRKRLRNGVCPRHKLVMCSRQGVSVCPEHEAGAARKREQKDRERLARFVALVADLRRRLATLERSAARPKSSKTSRSPLTREHPAGKCQNGCGRDAAAAPVGRCRPSLYCSRSCREQMADRARREREKAAKASLPEVRTGSRWDRATASAVARSSKTEASA